ncbi:MAG TPA: VOC family protein [Acidimicrobiales bacterium]|nr:VOC family protein [Acidimicrobiales bacterium]
MTLRPRGVNHLAISTCDMKAQLTFFGDVLGLPLKALYWMHGAEGIVHGFVELAGDSYVAFVQHPENKADIQYGVTHAGTAADPVTAGTMQHVAFHVDTLDEVLALRDRIRSRGVQVLGPIDHGFVQSMYFAGPEGLSLEICCGTDIDERAWIDPDVTEVCGISRDELAALTHPAPFERPAEPVAQPPTDPAQPRLHYPPEVYELVVGMSDQAMWDNVSETTPPVAVED